MDCKTSQSNLGIRHLIPHGDQHATVYIKPSELDIDKEFGIYVKIKDTRKHIKQRVKGKHFENYAERIIIKEKINVPYKNIDQNKPFVQIDIEIP